MNCGKPDDSLDIPISVNDLGEGLNKCYLNARQLLADAELIMAESKESMSSLSLLVLAVEEVAKIEILLSTLIKKGGEPVTQRDVDSAFRSHTKKLPASLKYLRRSAVLFHNDPHEFEHPMRVLNDAKMSGFYVDIKDGKFISPNEQEFPIAVSVVATIPMLIDAVGTNCETAESAIAFVQHLVDRLQIEERPDLALEAFVFSVSYGAYPEKLVTLREFYAREDRRLDALENVVAEWPDSDDLKDLIGELHLMTEEAREEEAAQLRAVAERNARRMATELIALMSETGD